MDLSKLNETDVREEILAPLLRELGYRSASQHNILREQSLRYPRVFIGRKDARRDPLLRGKADYILEAGGRVRWVLEAKAPGSDLTIDEIEQAWSYASHPEVRAVYFALCNGHAFQVFQTNSGPLLGPILSLTYQQLTSVETKTTLDALLSPSAVLRDHPLQVLDSTPPLGPGLRSIARVTGGYIRYDKSSVPLPALTELQVAIIAGAIERDEGGRMIALLETRPPTRSMQALLERMQLTNFEMICVDSKLSTSSDAPTRFEYNASTVFPEGEELPDLNTWTTIRLPRNLPVRLCATATGVLVGNRFAGQFRNEALYDDKVPVLFEGQFCLLLS